MNNDQATLSGPVPATSGATSQVPPSGPLPPPADNPTSRPKASTETVKRIFKIFLGLFIVLTVIFVGIFLLTKLFNKTPSGQVTLNYWGLWEDQKVEQGIISDFERQNPNIKINYSKQDIKQYRERLTTRISNGTGPDIFAFHNTWYSMISSVLLPLPSDTISKDEFSKSFYPVASNDLVRNGAIYGIPSEIDTLALYVNKSLFSGAGLTPPTNWIDLINDARAMTVKDENGKIKTAGVAMGAYDNITHAPDIVSLLFLQNGVDFKNMENSSDRIQGALSFYTSFATDENNVWDATLDPSILAFSKGNLSMFFGYSWDFFTIKQFNPNLDFAVVPVPQLPNQTITMASYWADGASLKSKHQKEALLFLKFLSLKETEEKLFTEESKTRLFGEPYARTDLSDSLKSNPNVYPFILQAPDALSSPFVDSTYDNGLNQQLNTYLGNAVNSMISGGSIESAYKTFSEGITQIIQKYGQ